MPSRPSDNWGSLCSADESQAEVQQWHALLLATLQTKNTQTIKICRKKNKRTFELPFHYSPSFYLTKKLTTCHVFPHPTAPNCPCVGHLSWCCQISALNLMRTIGLVQGSSRELRVWTFRLNQIMESGKCTCPWTTLGYTDKLYL